MAGVWRSQSCDFKPPAASDNIFERGVAAVDMVHDTEGAVSTAQRIPVYPFAWECYEYHYAHGHTRSAFLTHTDAAL
eukprot:COSAG02_NODE_1938_length_10312_cov_16.495741_7_plen_77_part_00